MSTAHACSGYITGQDDGVRVAGGRGRSSLSLSGGVSEPTLR